MEEKKVKLTVDSISCDFKDKRALDKVSFDVYEGEFLSILGPSGCGKTTLLRILIGLLQPTEGRIISDGRAITHAPASDRGMGIVFQNYALFENMTVLGNVEYSLKIKKDTKKDARKRAMEVIEHMGLKNHMDKKPGELSGGQQQRVAIARALATNPKVLLCDEATSALDPKTTRQILELIGDINKKLGITVVIITHQMSVVKEVCNHVAILDDGEVVEEGLVSTVFSAPKSAAARHLVFPRGADIDVSDPQQQRRIRLIFRSAKTTSIPLVAQLATEEGISATVISANTQKLSEEVYGSMLLGVPNAQFEQAMDFLRGIENLQVEEASVDVQ